MENPLTEQENAQQPSLPDPRSIQSPLRVDAIERRLQELGILDSWKEVVNGLRHGFDVGVRDTPEQSYIFENHRSASLDEAFIDNYIISEQAAGRYSQAFDPDDLEGIIGYFRTSPLGLVPKPNSESFRLVQDLSYPRDNVR